MEGDFGPELIKVELDEERRPGFLTRQAFLTSFAHPAHTAPILRGAYINRRILDIDVGSPDPTQPNLPSIRREDFTTERDFITELTSPPSCSGCHQGFINPPGFLLENYDVVGAWQEQDPLGGAIDPTVELVVDPSTKLEVRSAKQLMQQIAASSRAQRLFAEELVSAIMGRLPNPMDQCIVDELVTMIQAREVPILELVSVITQADSFRLRTAAE